MNALCESLCEALPDVFYLADAPAEFVEQLEPLERRNWTRLWECRECGGLWAIDEQDKYTWQVASRARNRDRWESATVAQRKALLFAARGGTGDTACIWAGCEQKRIVDVALCIDHLWETGARR